MAFKHIMLIIGLACSSGGSAFAETIILPSPECKIRDAVAENFVWYDSDNKLTASQRRAFVPYLRADYLFSNPILTSMVRRLSNQSIRRNQVHLDRELLKQAFIDSCPPSNKARDLTAEFEFAFPRDSFPETYIYGSIGSYLLNEKDRPDLAAPLLGTKYDLTPFYLWTNRPIVEEEETEADDSIFYQYQRYADRAKLGLLNGETDQIRKNAQDYLELIGFHKKYNQNGGAVTDLSVSYSLLKTLQKAEMTELVGLVLESEFASHNLEKKYLRSIPAIESSIDKAQAYGFLLRHHLDAVGRENLAHAMQYESLILEMGIRELYIQSSLDKLLSLNAERLEFSEQHLPSQHTMILRDRFYDEIFKLLAKTIKTDPSDEELWSLPKQDFRDYIAERQRHIDIRRMRVNHETFPVLEDVLSNWSESFAANSNMSRTDKDMRQKEIHYLQDWINTNKVP